MQPHPRNTHILEPPQHVRYRIVLRKVQRTVQHHVRADLAVQVRGQPVQAVRLAAERLRPAAAAQQRDQRNSAPHPQHRASVVVVYFRRWRRRGRLIVSVSFAPLSRMGIIVAVCSSRLVGG